MRKLSRTVLSLVMLLLFIQATANAADFSAWKYRLPITLTHRSAETSRKLPVDITFSVFADRCPVPEKEIRLVLKLPREKRKFPSSFPAFPHGQRISKGERACPH